MRKRITDFLWSLARSEVIHTIWVGSVLYLVADFFLPQVVLNTLIASLTMCLAAGVVFLYGPVALATYTRNRLTSKDLLVNGIFLSWLVRFILSLVALMTFIMGHSLDFNKTSLFGWLFLMVLLAGYYHVRAPTIGEGIEPSTNWRGVLTSLLLGFVLGALVVGATVASLVKWCNDCNLGGWIG